MSEYKSKTGKIGDTMVEIINGQKGRTCFIFSFSSPAATQIGAGWMGV